MIHTILYILLGAGLILLSWKVFDLIKKGNGKDKKIGELRDTICKSPSEKDMNKLKKEINYYESLCDYRVGLWSATLKLPKTSATREFDIEVVMTDFCEGRVKIKVLEVIKKHGRDRHWESQISKEWNGQWVDSNEIKELSNSKILTREKRMSILLDDKDK